MIWTICRIVLRWFLYTPTTMPQLLATMKAKRPNQEASYTLAGELIRYGTRVCFSSTERTNLLGA